MALITGRGLTVITAVKAVPTQDPLVGIMVYVAVPWTLSVLVSVPEKLAPKPLPIPIKAIVDSIGDQEYEVLFGTMPFVVLVGEYSKESPEHITVVKGLIWAVGFKFTVRVKGTPTQLPVMGLL
jgi:hypothetical protein